MASAFRFVCRARSYSTRVRWLHGTVPRQANVAAQVAVSEDRRKLTLQVEGEQERRFHGVWLRHNCRCPVCYSHDNYMSLVSYTQLIGVELSSARVQGAQSHTILCMPSLRTEWCELAHTCSHSCTFSMTGDEVIVDWIMQDGSTHTGCLSLTWLKENDYSLPDSFMRRQQEAKPLVAVSD